jgi:hypothetical protein
MNLQMNYLIAIILIALSILSYIFYKVFNSKKENFANKFFYIDNESIRKSEYDKFKGN